jgi:hypothetical protein
VSLRPPGERSDASSCCGLLRFAASAALPHELRHRQSRLT